MLKLVIAVTAILMIANSSNAMAQTSDDEDRGFQFEHRRLTTEDIKAFTDARIAALKAGLQLTPDQEKNWPSFEQAVRDLAKLRIERMQARERGMDQPSDPFDRLQRRADGMSRLAAALKRLADAGTPLYQSLNDAQKHRFMLLAHMLRPHGMGERGFWHGYNGMFGRGMGDTGRESEGGPDGMMEHNGARGHHDTGEEDL
jgi:zinc resistance-associated protein